jgi:hypothetical protein
MLIKPAPPFRVNGKIQLQAELTPDNGESRTLWYRMPEDLEHRVTQHSDPFVLGALFLAMRHGEPVHVEGTVSPSLLRNLDRYTTAWSQWKPDTYRRVEFTAREEREAPTPETKGVVLGFSGGIDSAYSAWTQAKGKAGRQQVRLAAGVFVLGFDIPLESENTDYASAFERARIMTDSIGIELIPVATNFRELGDWWEHAFATGLASVLHLFKSYHSGGMLAGDSQQYQLDTKEIAFGTSPFFDTWLGSDMFQIHQDGADKSRIQKVEALSEWPEAMRNIRVCWQGQRLDRNCCRCQKCICNMLLFRILERDIPQCFPLPLTEQDLRSIKYSDEAQRIASRKVVKTARDRGIRDSWVDALEDSLKPHVPEVKEASSTAPPQPDGARWNNAWGILRKLRSSRMPF